MHETHRVGLALLPLLSLLLLLFLLDTEVFTVRIGHFELDDWRWVDRSPVG